LASANQINLSAEKRWAEPLDKNFERVVTENLTELLNDQKIEKYPWARNAHVDYQVVIDVQRFEALSNGSSQLTARWMIRDGRSGQDVYAAETRSSTPVGSGETGASQALSQDLAVLSRDIAAKLSQLHPIRSGSQT